MAVDQQLVLKCALTAKASGCPKDQAENFLRAGSFPLPWQWRFHSVARQADLKTGPVDIGLGGARGPGKSHAVLSQVGIDDCQRCSDLKCLFLRKTGKAAKESFDDLVNRTLLGHVKFIRTQTSVEFPNRSKVILGGYKDEKDIDQYIGIEYDVIVVEEMNQLTETKVQQIRGSLRTSKANWRPRLYASFNPGGKGHTYVKNRYVIPCRNKTETETRFIPSTYKENPYVNDEYRTYLEGLAGNLGKAWREGDFDIFEGQFFTSWRYDKHVIEPFRIPETWRKFGGYDHGRAKPACFYWVAVDYDANPYVYRELYVNQEDGSDRYEAEDIAKEVVRITEEAGEKLEEVIADSSIFSKTGHGETIAEILMKNGMGNSKAIPLLIPSHKDRIARWAIYNQLLKWNNTEKPKLRVFNTCPNLIRTIPEMIHDELHPEDLDTEMEDHAVDATGYLFQTLRSKAVALPKTAEQRAEEAFNLKIGKIKNDLLGLKRFEV